MTAEIVFMRDDGDGHLELTSKDDPSAVAYVRADLADCICITKKEDFFAEDESACHPDMKDPCNICYYSETNELAFPCAACKHY